MTGFYQVTISFLSVRIASAPGFGGLAQVVKKTVAKLGPFELIQKLGAGATAEVFLASGPNARGEPLIALKVMLEHLAEDESTRKAFLQEGRTAALLRHPNIVEVFDVGEIEGRAYLAMELVRGWSVSAVLKKLKAAKETLPFDQGCEIVRQAALGLHFAHEIKGADGRPLGLVHRDVSPQNLILSERGEVKVADFGLAKATAAQATVTRGIRGKLKYMPPEQLKGEALDARSDVFALGAVLWELVTGQALYPANNEAEIFQQALFNPQLHPDEVMRGLSRALVDVLQKSVDRDPARRFQTALALAEQLLPLVQPGESAPKLGALIFKHFDPLPVSADLSGMAVTQQVKRRVPLPAPPSRLKPQGPDPREGATIMSLPPVRPSGASGRSDNSNPTIVALTPLDTLHDQNATSATFPTLTRNIRRPSRMLVPALIFAGIGIFTGAVVLGRYFNQRASQRPAQATFEEIPIADAPQSEIDDPPAPAAVDDPAGAKPANSRKKVREVMRGFVTIDANVPALVTVGGKEFGMTPVKVTLPIGRHRLKVATPDGTLANEMDMTIIAGGNGRRTVLLR